jgi:hypothetical protein
MVSSGCGKLSGKQGKQGKQGQRGKQAKQGKKKQKRKEAAVKKLCYNNHPWELALGKFKAKTGKIVKLFDIAEHGRGGDGLYGNSAKAKKEWSKYKEQVANNGDIGKDRLPAATLPNNSQQTLLLCPIGSWGGCEQKLLGEQGKRGHKEFVEECGCGDHLHAIQSVIQPDGWALSMNYLCPVLLDTKCAHRAQPDIIAQAKIVAAFYRVINKRLALTAARPLKRRRRN